MLPGLVVLSVEHLLGDPVLAPSRRTSKRAASRLSPVPAGSSPGGPRPAARARIGKPPGRAGRQAIPRPAAADTARPSGALMLS